MFGCAAVVSVPARVVNAPVLGVVLPTGVLLIDVNEALPPMVAIGAPFSVALTAVTAKLVPLIATLPATANPVKVPRLVMFGWLADSMVPVNPPLALTPDALTVVAVTVVAVTLPVTDPVNDPVILGAFKLEAVIAAALISTALTPPVGVR